MRLPELARIRSFTNTTTSTTDEPIRFILLLPEKMTTTVFIWICVCGILEPCYSNLYNWSKEEPVPRNLFLFNTLFSLSLTALSNIEMTKERKKEGRKEGKKPLIPLSYL
jgi:hypothetical protein